MFDPVRLPFWISIGALSLLQGAVVAGPRALGPLPARVPLTLRMRSRRWALVPPASVLAFVAIAWVAQRQSADALTYIALVGVPALAALALGGLAHGGRPRAALIVPALFALAWADRSGLAGEAAGVVLTALSCVALGALLGALTPARWLGAGIIAMAVVDTAFVVSDLLRAPNNALNAAHPAAGLPRLQSELFGSAVMGYGDLFAAGVLGGLLACAAAAAASRAGAASSATDTSTGRGPATSSGRGPATSSGRGPARAGGISRWQLRAALLTAGFAVCFDLLFLVVDELPATVPVALALIVTIALQHRQSAGKPAHKRTIVGRRASPAARVQPRQGRV
jgi:hypothetical protein